MKPIGSLVAVERIVETRTTGGIFIPQTFKVKNHGPAARLNAKGDWFRARVKAVGKDAEHDISPGDEVLVYEFADGDGSKMWTGEKAGDFLFVKYPDDLLGVVEHEPPRAEPDPFPEGHPYR